MKYVNQINFVMAVVGVAIVIYALSLTVFSPSPEVSFNLEELRRLEPRIIERPVTTDAPAVLRSSTTTDRSGVRPVTQAPAAERTARPSGLAGPNAPAPAPAPLGNRRELSNQNPGMPTWLGDRNARQDPSGSGVVMPSSGLSGQPRLPTQASSPVDSGARPAGSLVRPPAGAESVKRDATTDPPGPPMRSSMPQQPPQRRP